MTDKWKQFNLNACLFEPATTPAPTLKATKSVGSIPSRVDLRPLCSPVEHQGHLSSCAANATVGALEYHQRKAGLNVTDLSRLFVYWNARNLADNNEDNGTMIPHVMAAVLAFGTCEERVWPYIEAMVKEKPTPFCFDNAMRYEAVSYARTPLGDACLIALAQGLPVVFGTFMPGEYYDGAWTTATVPEVTAMVDSPGTGHAMLLVGYDIPSRTWLVRNSWGADFGEQGYFRIPFSTLTTYSPPSSFWTIGAIDVTDGLALQGASVQETVRATKAHAKEEVKTSLERLQKNLRQKLNDDLQEKKTGLRNRLRGPGVGGGY